MMHMKLNMVRTRVYDIGPQAPVSFLSHSPRTTSVNPDVHPLRRTYLILMLACGARPLRGVIPPKRIVVSSGSFQGTVFLARNRTLFVLLLALLRYGDMTQMAVGCLVNVAPPMHNKTKGNSVRYHEGCRQIVTPPRLCSRRACAILKQVDVSHPTAPARAAVW